MPSGQAIPKNLSENSSARHAEPVEGWLTPAKSRTLRHAQDTQLGFRMGSKPKPSDHMAHDISNKRLGVTRSVQVLSRWACLGLTMLLVLYAHVAIPVAAQSSTVDWESPFTLSSTPPNSEYPADRGRSLRPRPCLLE